MDPFLIFALERSGSSSLAAALNRELSVVQEPFSSLTGDLASNARFVDLLHARGQHPDHLPDIPEDPHAYNRFHAIAMDRDTCGDYLESLYQRFSGIKHVWNTVSNEANLNILDWCLANDTRIVFLTRKKLARSLVSRFLAQQAKVHDLGAAFENRPRWEQAGFQAIDPEELLQQLENLTESELGYRQYLLGKPHFLLTYERLYEGMGWRRRRTLAALCGFLGTEPAALDQPTLQNYLFNKQRKQTDAGTLKRIPNYRELRKIL
jgi:LPS sulfotransferase NodH